jgi:hypothetical protein
VEALQDLDHFVGVDGRVDVGKHAHDAAIGPDHERHARCHAERRVDAVRAQDASAWIGEQRKLQPVIGREARV